MQQFQDTLTGHTYEFYSTATLAELLVQHPELPKTLSATVVQCPSPDHVWNAGTWVIDPTKQQAALQALALDALNKTDRTVLRCYAASVPVPQTWSAYIQALRAIVNGADKTSTVLPAQPPYPSGT